MKHFIIVTALSLFFTLTVNAQEVNKIPIKELKVKYINVEFHPKTLFNKSYVIIDYGQTPPYTFEKERRRLGSLMESKKEMSFNSDIDVVNFLAENGFRFIESYQDIKTDVDNDISSTLRTYILENLNYK